MTIPIINFTIKETEVISMSFIYDKLFEKLKEKNISTYQLRQNGLSPTIINKLVHGQNVNTSTLEYFCKLLNCDIGDIMQYVPDSPDENRTQTDQE